MKILSGFVLLLISVCAYAQDNKPAIPNIDKINSLNKPLIVLDGTKKGSEFNFKEIDPNNISRIEVLKGDSAKFYYGEAGKNGVIVITSKLQTRSTAQVAVKPVALNKPLWIVEGVKKDETSIKDVNPNDIESISVIKDSTATAIYGDAGKNGVIIISLKKGSAGNPIKKIE